MCLRKCQLLSFWKQHKIIPVFRSKVKELQPISYVSISKVFERFVHDKMSVFLFDVLDLAQLGFLPKHHVCSELLQMVEIIPDNRDSNRGTDVIYLDIKKTFVDTVTHKQLL